MRKSPLCYLMIAMFILCTGLSAQAGTTVDKSQTWTKYPIVLVPGVFDFHNLFGMGIDYFYGIENDLEKTSYSPTAAPRSWWKKADPSDHQETHFIPLNPWQNTEERSDDLKEKLLQLMEDNGYTKVNIIAHSHGTTTARAAINKMCMEARDAGNINPIASFTSIDGPHRGTPVADFYMENPESTMNVLIASGVNMAGNLMVLISSDMYEYFGDQHSQEVFKDFSQESMAIFNEKYPSAGLPITDEPYGDIDALPGAPAGDGLGNAMDPNDPEAILYYSWTGNIGKKYTTNYDPFDLVMLATQQMNFAMDYREDADAFIPVSSAKFGTVIGEFYWNHIDAINQSMGLIHPDAESPKTIMRLHAQRLQKAGR